MSMVEKRLFWGSGVRWVVARGLRISLVVGLVVGFGAGCVFDASGLRSTGNNNTVTVHDAGADASPRPDGSAGDTDGDGRPDAADNCELVFNPGQEDADGDGVGDLCDNCQSVANPGQEDLDGDHMGNACDGDRDNDSLPNTRDPFPDSPNDVAYFSELETSEDHFWIYPDSWGFPGSGGLCQGTVSSESAQARLQDSLLAISDYLAETQITVNDQQTGSWETLAGLAFRVPDIGPGTFNGFVCAVNPEDRSLDLVGFNNGGMYYIDYSPHDSIPATGPYRLRVSADGQTIACELVGGPLLEADRSEHPVGTVGFYTKHTAACFSYLAVIGL